MTNTSSEKVLERYSEIPDSNPIPCFPAAFHKGSVCAQSQNHPSPVHHAGFSIAPALPLC